MRKRPIFTIVSTVLIIAGVAIGGYATLQIREMNVSSGSQVLPELTHFPVHAPPSAVYASIKIKRGDYLGSITIPVLKSTLPIYEGTEDAQLKMGVGHFEGSVLPGLADNSVLSGHRDSVFSQLGKLKVGQFVTVETVAGTFTYKISGFRIVGANDRTVIVPTKTAVLTLTTCYPFRFIGNAPQRFIVSADLVLQSPAL